jgi:hypothetical protein
MSQVTNLAFFRARRGSSRSSRAHPARSRIPQLRYSSRCADVFILYFANKTRRIYSGPSSYNIGPLFGREGVAQNIPSGRDDFLESPVGNAHRDSQNVNLIRLVLESAVQ